MVYITLFSTHIANIWNSMLNSVVKACSVNAFKAHLDKIWLQQDIKFNFTTSLSGTGNRSENIRSTKSTKALPTRLI